MDIIRRITIKRTTVPVLGIMLVTAIILVASTTNTHNTPKLPKLNPGSPPNPKPFTLNP